MPHYGDGTLARVGDVVKGMTYNKPGMVVGVVTRITPGQEVCNCEVQGVLRIQEQDGVRSVLPDVGTDYGEIRGLEKIA